MNKNKKLKYSREKLLPEDILSMIPYKATYEALEKGEEGDEALEKLLSSFVRHSVKSCYQRFEHIESKREKKNLLKAHVYLDALITLFRLPTQIQKPITELSENVFKGFDAQALRAILEKFT